MEANAAPVLSVPTLPKEKIPVEVPADEASIRSHECWTDQKVSDQSTVEPAELKTRSSKLAGSTDKEPVNTSMAS